MTMRRTKSSLRRPLNSVLWKPTETQLVIPEHSSISKITILCVFPTTPSRVSIAVAPLGSTILTRFRGNQLPKEPQRMPGHSLNSTLSFSPALNIYNSTWHPVITYALTYSDALTHRSSPVKFSNLANLGSHIPRPPEAFHIHAYWLP